MKFFHRREAIARINQLSATDRPFLFVVNYAQDQSYICPLDEIDSEEVLYAFPTYTNVSSEEEEHPMRPVVWDAHPESFGSYQQKFNIVQQHLHRGDSFLTNLTCRIPIQSNLSLRTLFLEAKAPYKLWFKDHLVCFSPEIFLRIEHGRIASYPMKGTIDATLPQAEEQLMNNEKEAAEHATIVDLIRNDLSIQASQVEVARYRYVDHLITNKGEILQTSSEIAGNLPKDYRLRMGDILFSQLPAGSITGAPKPSTVAIIREAEDYDRGFYTGVMGICHQGRMESAVMIRYIEQENEQLYFKAGGGITACSNCKDEYDEIKSKTYVPIY